MIFFKNTVSSNRQTSETFRLGGLLAVVGGFLDAYTYLIRGGVFANAQTGNIVLLGISLANGAFYKAFFYMIPITAFHSAVCRDFRGYVPLYELVTSRFGGLISFELRK